MRRAAGPVAVAVFVGALACGAPSARADGPPVDVRPDRARWYADDAAREHDLVEGLSRTPDGRVVRDARYEERLARYRAERASASATMAKDTRAYDELVRRAQQAGIGKERLDGALFGRRTAGFSDADLALTAVERERLARVLREAGYTPEETLGRTSFHELDAHLQSAGEPGRSLDEASRLVSDPEYMARFRDPSVAQHLKKLNGALKGGVPLDRAGQEQLVALYGKTLAKIDEALAKQGAGALLDPAVRAAMERLGARDGMVGPVVTLGASPAQARAEIEAWLQTHVYPALRQALPIDQAWRAQELARAAADARDAKAALDAARALEADGVKGAREAADEAAKRLRAERERLRRLQQWKTEDDMALHVVRRSSGAGKAIAPAAPAATSAAEVANAGLGKAVRGLAGRAGRRAGRDLVGAFAFEAGMAWVQGTPMRSFDAIALDAVKWTLRITQARDAWEGIRAATTDDARADLERRIDAHEGAGGSRWDASFLLWDVGAVIGRATLRSAWNALRLHPKAELVPYGAELLGELATVARGDAMVDEARRAEAEQLRALLERADALRGALLAAEERLRQRTALASLWRSRAEEVVVAEAKARGELAQALDALRRAPLPPGAVPLGFAVPTEADVARWTTRADEVTREAQGHRATADALRAELERGTSTATGLRARHGFLLERVVPTRAKAEEVRTATAPLARHAAAEQARGDPSATREAAQRAVAALRALAAEADRVAFQIDTVGEQLGPLRADVATKHAALTRLVARIDDASAYLGGLGERAAFVGAMREVLRTVRPDATGPAPDAVAGDLARAKTSAQRGAAVELPVPVAPPADAARSAEALAAWARLRGPVERMEDALRQMEAALARLRDAVGTLPESDDDATGTARGPRLSEAVLAGLSWDEVGRRLQLPATLGKPYAGEARYGLVWTDHAFDRIGPDVPPSGGYSRRLRSETVRAWVDRDGDGARGADEPLEELPVSFWVTTRYVTPDVGPMHATDADGTNRYTLDRLAQFSRAWDAPAQASEWTLVGTLPVGDRAFAGVARAPRADTYRAMAAVGPLAVSVDLVVQATAGAHALWIPAGPQDALAASIRFDDDALVRRWWEEALAARRDVAIGLLREALAEAEQLRTYSFSKYAFDAREFLVDWPGMTLERLRSWDEPTYEAEWKLTREDRATRWNETYRVTVRTYFVDDDRSWDASLAEGVREFEHVLGYDPWKGKPRLGTAFDAERSTHARSTWGFDRGGRGSTSDLVQAWRGNVLVRVHGSVTNGAQPGSVAPDLMRAILQKVAAHRPPPLPPRRR
ncbi:MAG: hypothetical protein IT460_02355 [Planctomycetes bacterium]|nr:hypothetical protein [Planctomycetota bacterium]